MVVLLKLAAHDDLHMHLMLSCIECDICGAFSHDCWLCIC